VNDVRLAATVILVRPPLEVYLMRRSSRSAFAPDAFVFPGGTVDPTDATPAARRRTLGLRPDRLAREFRATVAQELSSSEPPVGNDDASALFVTALRELFEEAGVLLARDAAGDPVAAMPQGIDLSADRAAMRRGELAFADFLERYDWFADATALTLFSHWITPASEPRRYNTHFFLAAVPALQDPLADAYETHDGIWMVPARALERYAEGSLHLVYPTIKHLERLRAFDSVAAAEAYARRKPVLTVMPAAQGDDFVIPEALENAW
jgi:8-oxo-dGTP pyrophosphatase MutT (NUDIX family)